VLGKIARKINVTVWSTPVEITVAQKSKTYWIAFGEHLDKTFAFRGRSEAGAVEAWTEAAREHASQTLVARLTVNRVNAVR
jgi:hypothetical protein